MTAFPPRRMNHHDTSTSVIAAQWRTLLWVVLPFAAASFLIYVAAGRDVLLQPHSTAHLWEVTAEILVKLVFGVGIWLAPLSVPWIRPRLYLTISAPVVCLLFVPNMMYALEYRELISIGAVEAVMSTTATESAEFLSERSSGAALAVFYSALLAGLFALAVHRIRLISEKLSIRTHVMVAAASVLVLGIGFVERPRIFPVTAIKNTVEYFGYVKEMDGLKRERASYAFGATRSHSFEEPETYVIVIGESMRRRQVSHYGYGRMTTPRLDTTSNLVFLEDLISASGTSQSAVKSALTPATAATVHLLKAPSVLRIAREIGFATTWISNQDRVVDTEIAILAEDADTTIFTNHDWAASGRYDEAVLAPLNDALSGPEHRKLIFVHLMGSHGEYRRRYPARFRRFASTECASVPTGCARGWTVDQMATINEYDNSIAYTDSVVSEVIGLVSRQKGISAVLFFADHGEELFDTPAGRMGHGFQEMTRYEVEIPSFVWLSPSFGQHRHQNAATIRANRYHAASSEDFFYVIADLLAADFPGMQPERSLFSTRYQEAPRRVATPNRDLIDFACLKQPSRGCVPFSTGSSMAVAAR